MLIETTDPNSNWQEVMRLWNEICWFRTPNEEVSRKAKALLIALWNEKDWLKSEFPSSKQHIEVSTCPDRVLFKVCRVIKLGGIDKNAANRDVTVVQGSFHEFQVALM